MLVILFEEKIASVLNDCPQETIFLAAVSGGADSMAMLAALCAVMPKERLFCMHVDHGIRPARESRGDAEFVRDFCEENEIKFILKSIAPGRIESYARKKKTGLEAAARFFRHRTLVKEAKKLFASRILIAHTKDDLLETALMRVLRGAGPAGLAAMPVQRGRILRPLLSISRQDVIEYLTEKKIGWREDSTNKDEKFLRNKIRGRLVPLLDESFSSWKSGITGMAETQTLAAAFIADEVKRRVVWTAAASCLVTDAENFFAQPQIIREDAIFQGLNICSKKIPRKGAKTRRTQRKNLEFNSAFSASPRLCVNSSCDTKPVKRSTIRRFCSGMVKTVDLGALRLGQKGGKIVISPVRKDCSETGFSLLIKEPGLYNLNIRGVDV